MCVYVHERARERDTHTHTHMQTQKERDRDTETETQRPTHIHTQTVNYQSQGDDDREGSLCTQTRRKDLLSFLRGGRALNDALLFVSVCVPMQVAFWGAWNSSFHPLYVESSEIGTSFSLAW